MAEERQEEPKSGKHGMEVDADEDAPEDVKRATSVIREIKKGEKDDTFEGLPRREEKRKKLEHCDEPVPVKSKRRAMVDLDCCRGKRERKRRKTEKFAKIGVYGPPCAFPKLEIVPRHCLNKQEYIDMLATPSRKCPPDCQKETVLRKVRPVSARIRELAQPPRQRMLITLRERAATLPPALLDNLVHTLEQETCFTPEQAAKVARTDVKRKKKKDSRPDSQRRRETTKPKIRKTSATSAGLMDKDAVSCQYQIAERFVKHLLKWQCPIPKKDFRDIADVIRKRLLNTMEWPEPLPGSENRESQQIRFLADVVACWIAGVLTEVAEDQRAVLEEKCRKLEEEMKAVEEEEETEEEDDDSDRKEDEDRGDEGTSEEEDFDKQGELYEDALDREPEREVEDKDWDGEGKREDVMGIEEESGEETKPEAVEESMEDRTEKLEAKVKAEPVEAEMGEPVETEIKFDTQTESLEPIDTPDEIPESPIELGGEKIEEEEEKENEKEVKVEVEAAAAAEAEEEESRKDASEDAMAKDPATESTRDTTAEIQEEEPKPEIESEYTTEAEATKLAEAELAEADTGETVSIKHEEEPAAVETERAEGAEESIKTEFKEEEEPTETETKSILLKDDEESVAIKPEGTPEEIESRKSEKTERISLTEETLKSIGITETFGRSELPFLTCEKIIDTLYKMVENSAENDGKDPTTNRIHRAIYERLYRIVEAENPKLLTEKLKDVMDVTCGKISVWLKGALTKSQIDFMERYVPEVESREIREWLGWLISVSEVADNWTIWLRRVIEDVQSFQGLPITRGEWQDWTSSVDIAALLWRRFHLQTVHQAHRNVSMLTGRKTVKTGNKSVVPGFPPRSTEELIRTTDLHA